MSRKQKNIHYIYKTTCVITGRWYVGMHSTSNLEDGYMGSGTILRHSIRKYGIGNHTKEILEFLPSREALVLREREIVNKELISDGKCMNLKEGGYGGGGFWSDEHRIKAQTCGGYSLREKLINDVIFFEQHSKISSERMKKTHKEGKFKYNNFEGKKHSDETKQKMSESSKGMGKGENNSQYGTCWITKDGVNKKIKKEDLELYLDKDWVKGRK